MKWLLATIVELALAALAAAAPPPALPAPVGACPSPDHEWRFIAAHGVHGWGFKDAAKARMGLAAGCDCGPACRCVAGECGSPGCPTAPRALTAFPAAGGCAGGSCGVPGTFAPAYGLPAFGASGGGCANGSCGTPSRGFFRR